MLHYISSRRIHPQSQRGKGIRSKIYEKYMYRKDRCVPIQDSCYKKGKYLCDIARKKELYDLLYIPVYSSSLFDCIFNGSKVIVH